MRQMNLREILYQYCKKNGCEDLSCIAQFAIVNYASLHKSKEEWINLSPIILNSYIGIGEDKVIKLLNYLSEKSEAITKSFQLYCGEDNSFFCEALTEDEINDENLEIYCDNCEDIHTVKELFILEKVDFIGNKEHIINELKIVEQDIAKEIIILNTNEEHIMKLANILVSRLNLNKDEEEKAKTGITKILYSVKEVSGLISGISGDVADTTNSVKQIIENFSGISTLKDIFNK